MSTPPKGEAWLEATNGTAWNSARCRLETSQATAVCLQETRLKAKEAIGAAKRWSKKSGWQLVLEEAAQGQAGKTKAGVGIAVRSGVGVGPWPGQRAGDHTLVKHRASGCYLRGILRGGLACGSVYLKDGEGMGAVNSEACKQLAARLAGLDCPWALGGDWNMTPAEVQTWASSVGGIVVAQDEPTCFASSAGEGSLIDFWVVSVSLWPAVLGTERVLDGLVKTHVSTRLRLNTGARQLTKQELVRPKAFPTDPPVDEEATKEEEKIVYKNLAQMPFPDPWEGLPVDMRATLWMENVEDHLANFHGITGTEAWKHKGRAEEPKLRSVCAMGRPGSAFPLGTKTSRAARETAALLEDLLAARRANSSTTRVKRASLRV